MDYKGFTPTKLPRNIFTQSASYGCHRSFQARYDTRMSKSKEPIEAPHREVRSRTTVEVESAQIVAEHNTPPPVPPQRTFPAPPPNTQEVEAVQIVDQETSEVPSATPAGLLLRDLTDPNGTGNRERLAELGLRILGGGERIAKVAVPQDQLIDHNLDARAAFVVSLIDGNTTYEEILTLCGLSRADAITILLQLMDQRLLTKSSN